MIFSTRTQMDNWCPKRWVSAPPIDRHKIRAACPTCGRLVTLVHRYGKHQFPPHRTRPAVSQARTFGQ